MPSIVYCKKNVTPLVTKKYKSNSTFLHVFSSVLARITILTEWLRHFNDLAVGRIRSGKNATAAKLLK